MPAKATTTTISCSSEGVPSSSATTFTCKAKVIGYLPTGTVSWSQAGTSSVSLSSATCTLTSLKNPDKATCSVTLTGTPPVGVAVHASYGGDQNNALSSGTHRLNLGKAKTTVAIACSSTTLSAGVPVACTATVQNGYFPTGRVTWARVSGVGGVKFSTKTCRLSSSGSCSVTVTGKVTGGVVIGAVYHGDPNNRVSKRTLVLTIT